MDKDQESKLKFNKKTVLLVIYIIGLLSSILCILYGGIKLNKDGLESATYMGIIGLLIFSKHYYKILTLGILFFIFWLQFYNYFLFETNAEYSRLHFATTGMLSIVLFACLMIAGVFNLLFDVLIRVFGPMRELRRFFRSWKFKGYVVVIVTIIGSVISVVLVLD